MSDRTPYIIFNEEVGILYKNSLSDNDLAITIIRRQYYKKVMLIVANYVLCSARNKITSQLPPINYINWYVWQNIVLVMPTRPAKTSAWFQK